MILIILSLNIFSFNEKLKDQPVKINKLTVPKVNKL